MQNEEIQRFIGEENITETEARQRESSFIPGVSAGTVANIANDIETRITQGEGTTDNQSKGAKLSDAQKVSAIRFNGLNGGSVIAFFENNITAADLAEDLWEARLRRAVSNGRATWQQLAQRLFRAQADMQRIDPAIRLFKKGITAENAAPQQIIEAYSSLQAADLLTNYAAMPLDASTKTLLGEVLASTRAMRAAALTAQVWRQVKDTADVDLVSMLAEEGLAVADYFTPAMQQASAEMEELGARDFIPDPAPAVAETIEQAKAEQQENAENPKEPEGTPQPIPAEESVIGEPIPAEDPLTRAPYNPQTGELTPSQGRPIRHNKKKGYAFVNNAYQQETDGTRTGAVSVDKLRLADTPNLKSESAISGGWTPLSPPIKGVQLADGTIVIYSGRARLAHAKTTGTPYILVNVTRASGIKTDLKQWMQTHDAYDNLLNGTAGAEQAALAWVDAKNKGVSYADFEAAGYVMKDNNGETTATMRLGITAAENATAEELSQLASGERNIIEILSDISKREASATASVTAEENATSVTIEEKDICRTEEEAKQKVGRKGAPVRLENKTLGIEADFSKKSEWKIVYTDSKGRSLRNLAELGYDDETAQTIFWTAYGNIVNLFENAYNKREEGVKQNKERGDRESFTHVYSDFAIEGIPDNLTADIVLKVPQKKKQTPTVYLLITDKKGKQQNTIDGVGKAPSSGVASAAGAIETENASSVNTESEDSASTASLTAENPDDILGGVKRARRSPLAERMMHHAQAEANRIRRTVKGKSNTKEAAEVMASVLIALETARKYVPTARIPRMTAKRAALEAYIAMMQEGRYGINLNGSTKRRGLTEAEIAATIDRAQNRHRRAGV